MQRSLGLVAAINLMLTPLWAAAQSTSPETRAREGFAGNLTVMSNGTPESVAVNYRTWFVPEGATIDDLTEGAGGNVVVEVGSGMLTAIINGEPAQAIRRVFCRTRRSQSANRHHQSFGDLAHLGAREVNLLNRGTAWP
jgi:hypothetical protein